MLKVSKCCNSCENLQITLNSQLPNNQNCLQSHLFNDKSRYYPQVAKYFKAKSDEEMTHAERFMEYQNQRGAKIVMEQVKMQGQLKGKEEVGGFIDENIFG